MTIAINSTRFIKSAGNDFFYAYFYQIAVSCTEHQFIFITPTLMEEQEFSAKNIIHVISSPWANNPVMWRIWLDYTLPGIARKYKTDVLINTGGVCSLRTNLPQHIFISDLSFLYFPAFFSGKQLYYLKKNMPAFLLKANTIVTTSDFIRKEIVQHYPIDGEKINIFPFIADDHYQPLNWKEKETVRERYTEGTEYFLFTGEIHPRNNLVNLLKAFSFFKKRQKTNMQLVIITNGVTTNDPFIENFKRYKYREEVNILADLPKKDRAKITAAAYAFVSVPIYEGMPFSVLAAMQCEVPVITSDTGALNDTTGDAALHANPTDFENIADKMMQLFKDETKRTELIRIGKLLVQKNRKDKMDDQWWKSILTSMDTSKL
ncbi:MAG: glycosyltransferase family 4 protein [Ferruginibacter sp.]|nr:glycosyltransferase family 4 protein [Ferruginibacter sp.]